MWEDEEKDMLVGLAKSEAAFVRSQPRSRKLTRNGWPDFMVEDAERTYGVEVKHGNDRIRPSQIKAFTLLERMGCPVFIWHTSEPSKLTPWRSFLKEQEDKDTARALNRERNLLREAAIHNFRKGS